MTTTLYDQLERRILLLDGGFGTMVQGYGLQEEDYRGRRFAGWPVQLKGCNDLLALTRPDVVREIHEKYLRAGADIIETDSFNANAVSLADYRLEECAYEISKAAAGIARSAADEFTARNPQKPRFVAGSVGPTNRTASMSADVQNPAAREVTFAQLVEAYTDQVRGLVDGGAVGPEGERTRWAAGAVSGGARWGRRATGPGGVVARYGTESLTPRNRRS